MTDWTARAGRCGQNGSRSTCKSRRLVGGSTYRLSTSSKATRLDASARSCRACCYAAPTCQQPQYDPRESLHAQNKRLFPMKSCPAVVPCNRALQSPPAISSAVAPAITARIVYRGRAPESPPGVVPRSRSLNCFNIFWEALQVCVANGLVVAMLWGHSTSGHDSGARLRGTTPGHDSGARLQGTTPRHDSRARFQGTTPGATPGHDSRGDSRARFQGTIPGHDSRARFQGRIAGTSVTNPQLSLPSLSPRFHRAHGSPETDSGPHSRSTSQNLPRRSRPRDGR